MLLLPAQSSPNHQHIVHCSKLQSHRQKRAREREQGQVACFLHTNGYILIFSWSKESNSRKEKNDQSPNFKFRDLVFNWINFISRKNYENVWITRNWARGPVQPGLLEHTFSYNGRNVGLGVSKPKYIPGFVMNLLHDLRQVITYILLFPLPWNEESWLNEHRSLFKSYDQLNS